MMNESVDKEVFCLKLQIDKIKFRKMSSEDTNLLASLMQIGTEQELLRKLPKRLHRSEKLSGKGKHKTQRYPRSFNKNLLASSIGRLHPT